MARSVVLSGGAEFAAESNTLDKAMLHLIKRRNPYVVILPAASAHNPRKAVRTGVRYFSGLGARAEYVMVVDAKTADQGAQAAAMEHADAVYITDGSPLDAVTTLQGSESLAILKRAWNRGAVLAAVGAGAMSLCERYWDGAWEPGLGLLTGIVVLPHHEMIAARFSAERLREGLPADLLILGLDEATGVILEGQEARVVGPGRMMVYRADGQTEYTDGQAITLDRPVVQD